MRPETEEAPRRLPRDFTGVEEEQEVDFGALFRRIASGWWLVAVGVAIGAVLGYLAALGGGGLYQANTTVYLGQPLSPAGGSQIQSLATNPATVSEIVTSDATVEDVAEKVGVPADRLQRGISTRAVASTDAARRLNTNPLVEIVVKGPWRTETAEAADLLAAAVVEKVSGYVDVKIRSFETRLASQQRELGSLERELTELQTAARGTSIGSVERLQLLSLIGFAEQRRGQLLEDRTETEQLLSLAETVERSAAVTEASATKVPAKSKRSSILVGAVIGLLAGALVAFFAAPLLARRRRAS